MMEPYDSETDTDDVQPRRWWRGCVVRLVAVFCILGILWLSAVQPYLVGVTQPAPYTRSLLSISLPGLDFGVYAYPARPGEPGRVVFWLFFHGAENMWFLPALPGAPALPEPTPPPEQHKYAYSAVLIEPRTHSLHYRTGGPAHSPHPASAAAGQG